MPNIFLKTKRSDYHCCPRARFLFGCRKLFARTACSPGSSTRLHQNLSGLPIGCFFTISCSWKAKKHIRAPIYYWFQNAFDNVWGFWRFSICPYIHIISRRRRSKSNTLPNRWVLYINFPSLILMFQSRFDFFSGKFYYQTKNKTGRDRVSISPETFCRYIRSCRMQYYLSSRTKFRGKLFFTYPLYILSVIQVLLNVWQSKGVAFRIKFSNAAEISCGRHVNKCR